MTTTPPQHTVFDDPRQVSRALGELQVEQHRSLTLLCETTDEDHRVEFSVDGFVVDITNNNVQFELTDAYESAARLRAGYVRLNVDRGSDSLYFNRMYIKAANSSADGTTIDCTLPETLEVIEYRGEVRMPLTKGMTAIVRVQQFDDQPPFQCRLVDLSISGCKLDVPLENGVLFRVRESPIRLSIEFPNSDNITILAEPRHIWINRQGLSAHIGFLFVDLSLDQRQKLLYWAQSIERELAMLSGTQYTIMRDEALFKADRTEPALAGSTDSASDQSRIKRDPLMKTLHGIVCEIAGAIVAFRNGRALSPGKLREYASELTDWLGQDRQRVMYALCCLETQAELFRHSVANAGRLLDLLEHDATWTRYRVDIALAMFLHDLGKTFHIDSRHPSLNTVVNADASTVMPDHANRLLDAIDSVNLFKSDHGLRLIRDINERLDGSGYPAGLTAAQLSPLGRAAQVVDALDTSLFSRLPAERTTADFAYKKLYDQSDRFDREWLAAFVQRQGLTPIGSLAYFSHGFLAWIMHVDEKGKVDRIRVVKNLSAPHRNMREMLNRVDFEQLGEFKSLVNPLDYDLHPF